MKMILPMLAVCLLANPAPIHAQIPTNRLPLRIGADQSGGNLFRGRIAAVRLYNRALSGAELKTLAQTPREAKGNAAGMVGQWLQPKLPLASETHFDFPDGGTIEAWIQPEAGASGRIVNKITPGGSDGFLLDTHPGNALRLIVGDDTLTHDLPWSAPVHPRGGDDRRRRSAGIVHQWATGCRRGEQVRRHLRGGRGRRPGQAAGALVSPAGRALDGGPPRRQRPAGRHGLGRTEVRAHRPQRRHALVWRALRQPESQGIEGAAGDPAAAARGQGSRGATPRRERHERQVQPELPAPRRSFDRISPGWRGRELPPRTRSCRGGGSRAVRPAGRPLHAAKFSPPIRRRPSSCGSRATSRAN